MRGHKAEQAGSRGAGQDFQKRILTRAKAQKEGADGEWGPVTADDVVDLERMAKEVGENDFLVPARVKEAFQVEIAASELERAARRFEGLSLNEAVDMYNHTHYHVGGVEELAAVRQIARFFPKRLG